MTMINAIWVATLSNGVTATELQDEWTLKPGERKPWIRLVEKCKAEGLHVTSLRVNIDGKTIHLPRLKNNKFEAALKSVKTPLYYSICYHVEVDKILTGADEKHFIDLTAHFTDFALHYMHDLQDGNAAWLSVTDNDFPIPPEALSPAEAE